VASVVDPSGSPTPLRHTLWRLGYCPVKILARASAQTGWLQNAERNSTPRHVVEIGRQVHRVQAHGATQSPQNWWEMISMIFGWPGLAGVCAPERW
jgi:hypothetical protein